MAGLLDEYPMPSLEPDPKELERLKYLALMRMGLGVASREPAGQALQHSINTMVAGQEAARREAATRAQVALEQMKYAQAARKDAQLQSFIQGMDPTQLMAAGVSPQEIAYAKANPEYLPKLLERLKPETMSPGQLIRVPGIGFIDQAPDKDGFVNIIDPKTFQIIGRKQLSGQTEAMARQAGAIKAAEQANTMQTIPGPSGPETRWGADIAGGPPAMRGETTIPQVAGQRPPPRFNFQNLKPADAAAVLADLQNPRPEPNPVPGQDNVIRGQNPVEMKRYEMGQSALTEVSKPIFEDQRKQFTAAQEMARHVNNMEKLDKQGVFDGPAGIATATGVNFLNSMIRALPFEGAADLQMNQKKLANTQTFESELSKMQQALGKAFPGQQSNYELQVVTNALPRLINSPEGRAQIYQAVRGAYEWQKGTYESMRQHMNAPENNGNLTTWNPPPLPGPTVGANEPAVSVAPTVRDKTPNATVKAFPKGPPIGTVIQGKRFMGGNPNDKANWE